MTLKKFSLSEAGSDGPSAFVLIDLDGAELATGIVRGAKKVLVEGARTLARSETYAWALMGERNSGASAGINADPTEQASAFEAFSRVLGSEDDATELKLRRGKGVPHQDNSPYDRLLAHSVVSAAAVGLGGLDGRVVTLESDHPAHGVIAALLGDNGATVESISASDFGPSEGDALICGSRAGVVDHDLAALLHHRVIIPLGPAPLTSRAFAVTRNRGGKVLPDFLTTCGPLFGHRVELSTGSDEFDLRYITREVDMFVTDRCNEFESHPDGPFMAACHAAEDFLRTWQDELPFGRPLA